LFVIAGKLEINIMDNKQKTDWRDRDRINIHENYEVEYWTKELGISREKLKEAVNSVGTSAAAVRDHLKK
jgi:hypothetical protein